MGVVFLCREVDRATGKIAVYPVGKVPGDRESLLFELQLRQSFNPELQYFAVTKREFSLSEAEINEVLGREDLPGRVELSSYGIARV